MKMTVFMPFLTYPDASPSGTGPAAAAIARHLDAGIHAMAVSVDIPPVSNSLSRYLLDLPAQIRNVEAASRSKASSLLDEFTLHASAEGCDVTSEEAVCGPALAGDAIAERARYFDLSLCGWAKGNPASGIAAEALVFGSGRPALMLPDGLPHAGLDHVVIAWDASRTAARAVADARPFLERAANVTVVTVSDEKTIPGRDAAGTLAQALAQRGLQTRAESAKASGGPIGVALQETALRLGGKMLVMGGYGHSRLRDFVLGGATEGILSDLRMPVLLSH